MMILTSWLKAKTFTAWSIGTVLVAAAAMFGSASGARGQAAADGCWIRNKSSDPAHRASPHDSTSLVLDGAVIKVCYGRPGRHHRQIMGHLVPYGTAWRLGADEATAIHLPFPGRIAGVNVMPGWYSLYAIPEAKEWRIVVNADAQRWGIPINDAVRARDVGFGVVPTQHLDEPVDFLTMTIRRNGNSAATLEVDWENTRVRIPVERR